MPQAKAREMKEATPTDAPVREQDAIQKAVDARGIRQNNETFVNALTGLSDESFHRIWDNPRDAEYDDL
jgi:hypothetical protein